MVDISILADRYSTLVDDSIGTARDARFMANGARVLVLDEFSPHLRLFTGEGELTWQGGRGGPGPQEIRAGALATLDSVAVVAQQRRVSYWKLEHDSLALVGSRRLPPWLIPYGIEYGCDDDLVLYGRRLGAPDNAIPYVFSARESGDSLVLEARWVDTAGSSIIAFARQGALITRFDSRYVVAHYTGTGGRRFLEFDCDLALIRTTDETPFLRQFDLARLGAAAVPEGFVASVPRTRARPARGSTMLYRVISGVPLDSTEQPDVWFTMHFHPQAGLLLTRLTPKPHFVIVPLDAIAKKID